MGEKERILIIEFTNYEDYPIGGYLSFARSLMKSFGNSLAIAGITTSNEDPVGIWFKKEIDGSVSGRLIIVLRLRLQHCWVSAIFWQSAR